MSEWHQRARHRLETLNFEGLDQMSYLGAAELLLELARVDLKPDRIVRTAEDLIAMWFKQGTPRIHVEACDDGEFVLSVLSEEATHTEYASAREVADELAKGEPMR